MSRETITRPLPVEGKMHLLAVMAGDGDSAAMMDRDEQGRIVLQDISADSFRHIMQYLRDGGSARNVPIASMTTEQLASLRADADYLMLSGLVAEADLRGAGRRNAKWLRKNATTEITRIDGTFATPRDVRRSMFQSVYSIVQSAHMPPADAFANLLGRPRASLSDAERAVLRTNYWEIAINRMYLYHQPSNRR